jgi:predicted transcriptional regulator of viral defense system
MRSNSIDALRSMKHAVSLLSEHAHVLLYVSNHPEATVCEIAKVLGTSERQLYRSLSELQRAGYLTRVKNGRRNRYLLKADAPLHEGPAGQVTLSEFLALLARQAAAGERESETVEAHRFTFSLLRSRPGGR